MVSHVIIGSEALSYHCPEFTRQPKDIDIIITEEKFNQTIEQEQDRIECINHSPTGLSHIVKYDDTLLPREFFIADKQESLMRILEEGKHSSHYADLETLYLLKKSHIHYPIKFFKHIEDFCIIRSYLRRHAKIDLLEDYHSIEDKLDTNPELSDLLAKDIEKRLGVLKTPKMNQSTEKFFGKSKKFVKSYYVHDDMHKAIARLHSGNVAYEKILKDKSEVETDINKWKDLNAREKVECVLEEVYVIALERKILPMMFESNAPIWDARGAFNWALMRVCTTLCDGFFREFAVRAYKQIERRYNDQYIDVFLRQISQYDRIEANRD